MFYETRTVLVELAIYCKSPVKKTGFTKQQLHKVFCNILSHRSQPPLSTYPQVVSLPPRPPLIYRRHSSTLPPITYKGITKGGKRRLVYCVPFFFALRQMIAMMVISIFFPSSGERTFLQRRT